MTELSTFAKRDAWNVDFVSPATSAPNTAPRPAYLLRSVFEVPPHAVAVILRITAHGCYTAELDGHRVSAAELAPGWTSYQHRLRYATIDLTKTARPGRHVLGVWLADGWYRGRLGFGGGLWDVYGPDIAVLAQLDVAYEDGSGDTLPLTWRFSEAPITAVGLYEGETYDARREPQGWSSPSFDDSDWQTPVQLPITSFPHRLESPIGADIEIIEQLAPVAVERRPNNRIRLDFGQNIAGKLQITGVTAAAGHTIRLHHAEVLEPNGELAIAPLRTATSVDSYTFADSEPVTWSPRFTLHGFRYVEIEGWPEGAPDPAVAVKALVVHSRMERTGWFECSNELLNKFHQNVVWSMRGNFVGIPTDCPQRDERLGWTGDIQIFAPAATYLYNCTDFLRDWLRDVMAEQKQYQTVLSYHPWLPLVIPPTPVAAWGDVAVLLPWAMYQNTGDSQILAEHIESMVAWVETIAEASPEGLWNKGFQFGDWLDPAAPPLNPADARTDKYLVATAYHAYTSRILAQALTVLGDSARAAKYQRIADRARRAFQNEYVTISGRVVSDTTTALSLAICFDLLEPEQRQVAGVRLKQLVQQADHTITTGFVGTPLVCDALTSTGSLDTAYHLLLQTKCPSWLYPVTMGATTIWERWDSMLPDGSLNADEMTSFNHYALGAVVDFMHRVIGGLAPASPGYRQVKIAPQPGGGLTHAKASHLTPQGMVQVVWERVGESFQLSVNLPPGVTGIIQLPDGSDPIPVAEGNHSFSCSYRAATADPLLPPPLDFFNPENS